MHNIVNSMSISSKIERLHGPTVRLHFTADDWMLYNADTQEQEQDRDFVAMDLNRAVEEAVASSPIYKQVQLPRAFADHSTWGASDTVVREFFYDVVEEIYHGHAKRTMA